MEYFGLETICGILQGTDTVSRAFQVRDNNRYISGETKLVEYFCLGSIDATFQTGVVDQTGVYFRSETSSNSLQDIKLK